MSRCQVAPPYYTTECRASRVESGSHDGPSFHVKRDAHGLTLGQRLKKARLQASGRTHPPRQIGQQEVADLFGASQDAVSRWEKDQREPGLEVLARLADFYGVSRDWLAFGDTEAARRDLPEQRPDPRVKPAREGLAELREQEETKRAEADKQKRPRPNKGA
jgi:transcriptional regulator with XRE-family HTH domain